jgi:peptidoglycan-associated lipoprotein
MKKYLLTGLTALALLGCASGVRLDDAAPVEDRSATAVTTATATEGNAAKSPGTTDSSRATGAGTPSLTAREVAPVDLTKSDANGPGPAGSRIVYFDYDSFVVKPEFQPVLDAQAKYLKADRTRKASIEGNTDERGGREYNLALGQKRAEAVRRALGLLGVADAQLDAVSFGKEKPAISGTDEQAMAKNRRAEVTYRP